MVFKSEFQHILNCALKRMFIRKMHWIKYFIIKQSNNIKFSFISKVFRT